jgi:glycosyltransferase involved in cell wall biosynthesis
MGGIIPPFFTLAEIWPTCLKVNSLKKILFLSKGHDASSTRYRALQFFDRFAKAGFCPCHKTVSGRVGNYIAALLGAREADYVIVLRKTFPPLYLWLLRKVSRRLLFDFDDAIFCNTDGSPSATRMSRFAAITSIADHIFAGNRFLAAHAKEFNPAVSVVPTSIDPANYNARPEKPIDFIDLVWIGSGSTRKYLMDALPWLALAAKHIPNLRLKIIADFDISGGGVTTLPIPWSKDREADDLASAHIGIAPMRDDDWSRGKCALKVLQYMAAGLPVISSAAGVNAEVLEDGACGYLASSPQEWVDRLVKLTGDSSLRRTLGDAGHLRVETAYSNSASFSLMLDVLEELR